MIAAASISLSTALVVAYPQVPLLSQERTPYRFMDDLDQSDGETVDIVSMKELVTRPSRYHKRTIRVDGELLWNAENAIPSEIMYSLRDGGYKIRLMIFPESPVDLFALLAHRVRVRGKFVDYSAETSSDRSWKERGRQVIYADDIVEVSEPTEPSSSAERDLDSSRIDPPGSSASVVSVLPRRGRRDIPLESVFEVSFSCDMDPSSFQGNVQLTERTLGSDDLRRLDVELRYDSARQTLVVSPNEPLGAHMEISLLLYRGIADVDGRPLAPERQAIGLLQSRRSAVVAGADLGSLKPIVTIVFETRGF